MGIIRGAQVSEETKPIPEASVSQTPVHDVNLMVDATNRLETVIVGLNAQIHRLNIHCASLQELAQTAASTNNRTAAGIFNSQYADKQSQAKRIEQTVKQLRDIKTTLLAVLGEESFGSKSPV